MPFCPNCKYEYNSTVSVCPDCNENLVETLPEDIEDGEIESEYENWTPICRLTSQQYSEMLVEALESKDIPAIVYSGAGHFGSTGQMGTNSILPIGGAYTVMVPKEFADDAANEASIILGDDWEKVRMH